MQRRWLNHASSFVAARLTVARHVNAIFYVMCLACPCRKSYPNILMV